MRQLTLTRLSLGLVVGGALAVPVTVAPTAGGGIVVRINDACAQKTSCVQMESYICAHKDGNDYVDYKCTAGCRVDPE